MAAVIGLPNVLLFLMNLTISAFWPGDDLYTIIDLVFWRIFAKLSAFAWL